MGKYSEPLAARFADLAGVRPGQRVLDVGCWPGALTAELVSRVGPDGAYQPMPTGGSPVALTAPALIRAAMAGSRRSRSRQRPRFGPMEPTEMPSRSPTSA